MSREEYFKNLMISKAMIYSLYKVKVIEGDAAENALNTLTLYEVVGMPYEF